MIQAREIRAASLAAAVVAAYMALVLASGLVDLGQFRRLLSFYLGASFGLWMTLGIVALFVELFRHARRSGGEPFLVGFLGGSVRDRWERDRFVSLFWPPLLFATLMASFNAFKQTILPTAGFELDPFLAQADRLLFLGRDGWRVTHALLGSADATLAIDRVYHGWFLPMCIGLIVCAWLPRSTYRLRTQYMLSYIAVWIGIGSVLAYLMPSAGPCFYSHFHGAHGSYDELLQRLAAVQSSTGLKLMALSNQAMLIEAHESATLAIGSGISAMPSVHCALSALFALAAFRLNRVAGWVLTAYAGVIWVGSIHLGWHYALDGIVSTALTLGIWRVCGRIADRLERPILGAEARPAIV